AAAKPQAAQSQPQSTAAAKPQASQPQVQAQSAQTAQSRPQNQGGAARSQSAGGDRRFQGQGSGDRRPQGQGRSQSIPKAPIEGKPLTKESRNRTDRDKKNDRSSVDKFDKLERTSIKNQGNRPNQKNNNGKNGKNAAKGAVKPTPVEKKEDEIKNIILPETLTIGELAEKMKVQPAVVIKKLFLQGKVVTVNQDIDYDTAEEIALEFNFIAEKEVKVDVIEELLKEEAEDESTMIPRPPVVCVMGHVDHGKTSLLDAIRNTHVIAKEAGGITQHIGAYVVNINGQKITFLDTPGHEAFTAMRMRGANSTDIAILVVAADDGVMPQTIEAISHAKAAGIEIIVAINKIDKPSANVERVKQELSEYELVPEDWGGSTVFVPVSAHTHEGIEQLLEMILLTAEISELKANPNRKARGLVLEAQLDKGKGPVATVLVQKGTLRVGDPVAAGACHGKVRAMMDDKGRRVKEAGPSTPVEILGLSDVPNAGEIFVVTENEKEARSFAETFISEGKEKLLEETKSKMSLDDLFSQIQAGNLKELGIIVKADVQGSVEAVKQSLLKLSNEEVVVKIIHSGVGAINESDVTLAATSNAIIIGFNVRPDSTAKATAEREGVDVRLYRVIYDAIADVEAAMKGMLDPIYEEKVIGHAEVRQTFKASGVGTIAGSYVLDGVFQRNCKIRISREGKQIYEGALASLKRFKDDVKEVKAGYECGLVFEKFNDIQEFDQVEAYTMVEVPR
ncbi:MAG: translation initiation factor IF-2, partial [Eubacteriales bacterium]|nr:translation initiation factor IF-2 [Eubacteriales bacterium]